MHRTCHVKKRGQVMLEFTVVAGMVVVTLAILSLLLHVFGEYGDRIINLIAFEYP